MKKLIAEFTKQLAEANIIGQQATVGPCTRNISNVVISGLGGSGIGGRIVAAIVADEIEVPVAVINDYFLPAYVGTETLLIVCSYSGNTEETIHVLESGIKTEARIICITSGGKIQERANEFSLDYILIPGGMPPRACLGYSLIQLFFILNHFQLIGGGFKSDLKSAIAFLDKNEDEIIEEAVIVARQLLDKIPVLYCAASAEAIAVRFRQQLNENSKTLCWHHTFPEMNHNELVGWTKKNNELAVIILRNDTDYERIQKRMEICKGIFSTYTSTLIELHSKGNSPLEKALYLIHLCDWISCYLAAFKRVDALEVSVIESLKSSLAKV